MKNPPNFQTYIATPFFFKSFHLNKKYPSTFFQNKTSPKGSLFLLLHKNLRSNIFGGSYTMGLPYLLSSTGKVGRVLSSVNLSKSLRKSLSCIILYFSNSVSAYSFASSWLMVPASASKGRSSLDK